MENRIYKMLPEPPSGLLEWCKEQALKLIARSCSSTNSMAKEGPDGKFESPPTHISNATEPQKQI
jgi:hypothetical protein